MPGQHPPAYLSPSRLTCYQYCPAEFFKRYILKKDEPPTPERLFGTAVHKGLEAYFCGKDDELAFLREWRALKITLRPDEQAFTGGLDRRGLEVLEMVRALELHGEPERHFIYTRAKFIIPVLGYIDLWDESSKTIIDFKTAGYGWTQEKADAQLFQPALYSHAMFVEFGYIPTFKFIVMPRIPGPIQVFDATRSVEEIDAVFELAYAIHQAIERQEFDCTCGKHVVQAA